MFQTALRAKPALRKIPLQSTKPTISGATLHTSTRWQRLPSVPSTLSPLISTSKKPVLQGNPLVPNRTIHSTRPLSSRFGIRFSPDWQDPLNYQKWDTGTRIVVGLIVLGGVYYVVHLERVPETGRLRFMDISERYERKLTETSRAELLEQFHSSLLPPSHPISRHVKRVVSRILEANNLGHVRGETESPFVVNREEDLGSGERTGAEGFGSLPGEAREWNVMVVNDPKMVNAMAAYGNVVVFTGLLPVCGDEENLAAVLGHEIGHSVARHSSERYSSIKVLLGLALLLESLGLDFGIARVVTNILVQLPNSRTQELEADMIGLRLIAKACYDPMAAKTMQDKLERLEQSRSKGGFSLDFLRTHPRSEQRSKILEESLPEAYQLQQSADCTIASADGTEREVRVELGSFLDTVRGGVLDVKRHRRV